MSAAPEHSFHVSGMDCPSCAAKVEAAVRQLVGTSDITVDFAKLTLSVRLNDAGAGPDTVAQAVEKLGYVVERR